MVQIRWIYAPTSCSSSRDYTVSSEMNSCAHRLCIIEVVTPVLFLVWGQNLEGHPRPQRCDTLIPGGDMSGGERFEWASAPI